MKARPAPVAATSLEGTPQMQTKPFSCMGFTKRAALCLLGLVPARAAADFGPHRLRLYSTHTFKHIDIVYKIGGEPVDGALERLTHFLGDRCNARELPFDPALFDVLTSLAHKVGRDEAEFQVICGYRSPETNEMLRATTTGVARGSLHMQARAIDIRLPGTPTAVLRDAAIALGLGGVGYYRRSDFIHVDTGPVRRW